MTDKDFKGNPTFIGSWKKPSLDDVEMETRGLFLSKAAIAFVDRESKRLGLTRSEFVELAATSSRSETRIWNKARERQRRCEDERKYLAKLRKQITWANKQQMKSAPAKTRELMKRIVEEGLSGAELEEFMKASGLAFIES